MSKGHHRPPDDYEVKFVRWFRHPTTGKKVYAEKHGKKAFPIRVRRKR